MLFRASALKSIWENFLLLKVVMKKVHLTREQRYTISAMHKQGCTQKLIARTIGKNKSVVSRKLKRNANPKGKYFFSYAQDMAELRKERYKKPGKLLPAVRKKSFR
jgi:IS30 family transposase